MPPAGRRPRSSAARRLRRSSVGRHTARDLQTRRGLCRQSAAVGRLWAGPRRQRLQRIAPRGAASPPACALIGRVRATRRCAARISERLRSVSMASRSKSAGCSPARTRTSRATGMAASRPTASGSSSNRLPLPGRLAEAGVGGLGVDAALPPAAARLSSRLALRRDTMASASSHCCCSSRPEYCAACSSCLNIADSRLESSSCA
mmetsp:Transcript_55/g.188  ORF Transcript_55/g.188 Transcript_55/m.188 type:complete len:205 (-) Transcript_55:93-707(-)